MLTKYRNLAILLVSIVAVAIFIAWIISGSVPFQSCFQGNEHANTYKALYENDDFVTKEITRIRLNGECALRFFGDDSSVITALATILIAAFTFTLWRATDRMWLASKDQLKTASDALEHTISVDITTQRAYLTRSGIATNINITDDGKKIRYIQFVHLG
jgi:hypothetical protein